MMHNRALVRPIVSVYKQLLLNKSIVDDLICYTD